MNPFDPFIPNFQIFAENDILQKSFRQEFLELKVKRILRQYYLM